MKWNLENRKLTELKPFKRNPRTFTKKGMSDLKQSIDKFGLCEPIIIQPSGLVIGGHARLDILKKGGVKEVDVHVPENELSEDEFKELNLRLNKNFGGEFSFEMLQSDFKFEELISMGFEQYELGIGKDFEPVNEDEQPRLDEKTPIKCPECGNEFTT